MKKIFTALILIALFLACSTETKPPDELIDEQTYQQMFMEFAIINQLDRQLLENKTEDELRELVYQHYNVTEEQFRVSHEYYEQQVLEQVDRVQDMSQTLRAERDSLLTIEREYGKLTSPEQVDSLRQILRINE